MTLEEEVAVLKEQMKNQGKLIQQILQLINEQNSIIKSIVKVIDDVSEGATETDNG